MRFYLIAKGVLPDPLLIGETSFKKFWPDQGFESLLDILIQDATLVELIEIRDSANTVWDVSSFLTFLTEDYDVVLRDNDTLRDLLHNS